MKLDKKIMIFLGGIIWGLAGFSPEIIPSTGDGDDLIVRLLFIAVGLTFLITNIAIKIQAKYYISLTLFIIYLIVFLFINALNTVSFNAVTREIILIIVVMVIFSILSSKKYTVFFLKGLFVSLVFLTWYYFFSIDFSLFFSPFYRLFTHLNANGIGEIGAMTFLLSYYAIFKNKQNTIKYFMIIMAIISVIVVLATRSRTSLAMILVSYFFINTYWKNNKILIFTFIIISVLFIKEYTTLEIVFRLDSSGVKNISNLTGRTEIWLHAFEIIKEHFLFGIGSSNAFAMVDGHKSDFHNAFIQILVTSGFLGFLPIAGILILSFRNLLFSNNIFIIKIIFITGLIGSFAENHLLNFGSPANLLLLISILFLSSTYIKNQDMEVF